MRAARDMHAARYRTLCADQIWMEPHASRRRERAEPVGLARQSDLRDLRALALVCSRLFVVVARPPAQG